MIISCFIRYEIDPLKKGQFTAYVENWARLAGLSPSVNAL